ncbi:MAG: HIT domain-containing protein [Halioglobus sp.]|nr:HIT domain-containing protein [Halioglobus sp.]
MTASKERVKTFEIPQRLRDECHHLGSLSCSEILLHRNAALPWFILVPRTQLEDFLDLPEYLRRDVLDECAVLSAFIKQQLGYGKVNFAGLGNVVRAMHLHIIGRRVGDSCWPQPVWNNLPSGQVYGDEQLRKWQTLLVERAGLRARSLSV